MSKKTETQATETVAAAQPAVNVVPTKSATGIKIMQESYAANPVPQRKDIIQRLIKEAAMTPAYAATYLQNFKRKNGLSKPRAEVVQQASA